MDNVAREAPSRGAQVIGLLIALLVCYAVALFGARFAPGQWYLELEKPAWTPPSILFPIVWNLLYLLMAVAVWRVWRSGSARRWPAIALFALQLTANGAWSWLFFGRHLIGAALYDLGALLILLGATLFAFWRVDRLAAALLVPYFLWVMFAGALNAAIWALAQR